MGNIIESDNFNLMLWISIMTTSMSIEKLLWG